MQVWRTYLKGSFEISKNELVAFLDMVYLNWPSGFSHTLSLVPVLNQYVRPSGLRCSVYRIDLNRRVCINNGEHTQTFIAAWTGLCLTRDSELLILCAVSKSALIAAVTSHAKFFPRLSIFQPLVNFYFLLELSALSPAQGEVSARSREMCDILRNCN